MNKKFYCFILVFLSLFSFQTAMADDSDLTLFSLPTMGTIPTTKAGTCTGGSWTESGVNSQSENWTINRNANAYICCNMNNALKEGDAISITAMVSSETTSGFSIYTSTDDTEVAGTITYANSKNTQKTAACEIDANSKLIGKKSFVVKISNKKYIWTLSSIVVTRANATVESVSFSEAMGMCTYSNNYYAVDFSKTAAKAYIITGVDDKSMLICKKVTKVPAQTGVLLVGDKGASVSPEATCEADDVTGNLLVADDGTTTADDHTYILTIKDGKAGFYKSSSTRTLTAGKAHLSYTKIQSSKFFSMYFEDDSTTGVGMVAPATPAVASNSVIYNLAGQRVDKGYKGVVIVNGKKYIQK